MGAFTLERVSREGSQIMIEQQEVPLDGALIVPGEDAERFAEIRARAPLVRPRFIGAVVLETTIDSDTDRAIELASALDEADTYLRGPNHTPFLHINHSSLQAGRTNALTGLTVKNEKVNGRETSQLELSAKSILSGGLFNGSLQVQASRTNGGKLRISVPQRVVQDSTLEVDAERIAEVQIFPGRGVLAVGEQAVNQVFVMIDERSDHYAEWLESGFTQILAMAQLFVMTDSK